MVDSIKCKGTCTKKGEDKCWDCSEPDIIKEGTLKCSINGERCQWKDNQSEQNCKNCSYLIRVGDKPKKSQIDAEASFDIKYVKPLENKELLTNPTKAARFNDGKPKWGLVHYESMEPMIRVLEFGALKYAPKNWQKLMDTTEILESMQRHLAALMDGELVDKESGLSHMGHIQANAMFYNYHIKNKENDQSNCLEL